MFRVVGPETAASWPWVSRGLLLLLCLDTVN